MRSDDAVFAFLLGFRKWSCIFHCSEIQRTRRQKRPLMLLMTVPILIAYTACSFCSRLLDVICHLRPNKVLPKRIDCSALFCVFGNYFVMTRGQYSFEQWHVYHNLDDLVYEWFMNEDTAHVDVGLQAWLSNMRRSHLPVAVTCLFGKDLVFFGQWAS